MPTTFDTKYIDNNCLKELLRKYYNDKRYSNIPREEKKKMLVLIRSRVSFEISMHSSKLDGDEHYARTLVNLEKIDSPQVLEGTEYLVLRWLWDCITKDLNRISEIFLYEKVQIPQGDEQKTLQDEYLEMISDVTKTLIKKVVENVDELDASYISDNELNTIIKRYEEDQRFPTINSEEKGKILKRIRHRVAMVIHDTSNEGDGEKTIAKWLLNLENVDKVPLETHAYSHVRWLWGCVKRDPSEMEDVFKYDAISIPHEDNQVNRRNDYLELIADATKELIKETALSFDESNQYDVTVTSVNVPQHTSILKKSKALAQDDKGCSQEKTKHIVWQLSTTESGDEQSTKKRRITDNVSAEENLFHATTSFTH